MLLAAALWVAGSLAFVAGLPALGVAIFAVMYIGTGVGVTVGYHRLFTHRAFETTRPIRATLGILGNLDVAGAYLGETGVVA